MIDNIKNKAFAFCELIVRRFEPLVETSHGLQTAQAILNAEQDFEFPLKCNTFKELIIVLKK